MEKLAKPPLSIAVFRLTFSNNLKIPELRSTYYESIKSTFPIIFIPEMKTLAYDFGDCNFQSPDRGAQISIGLNYFSYVTGAYVTMKEFWGTFQPNFAKFAKLIGLSEINGFTLDFRNTIRHDQKLGIGFADYFAFQPKIELGTPKEFLTLDGSVVYKVNGDLLELNIRPLQNQQTQLYDSLQFNIKYMATRVLRLEEELSGVRESFNMAHQHVEDAFTSYLNPKYLESIK